MMRPSTISERCFFIPLHVDVLTCHSSFLQSIFPKFCECADAFMERLKPLADGKTQVAMKKEIYRYSMDFVSQVSRFVRSIKY